MTREAKLTYNLNIEKIQVHGHTTTYNMYIQVDESIPKIRTECMSH